MIKELPQLSIGMAAFDAALEEWREGIEASRNIRFMAPLREVQTNGVRVVTLEKTPRVIARITGSNRDGSYSWVEVYGSPGNYQTVPGGLAGSLISNLAWELNLDRHIVPNAIVWLELDKSTNTWVFAAPNGLIAARGTINAATNLATPANGTVTLLVPSGTGWTTSGAVTVTAYSDFPAATATNGFLWLTPSFNGLLRLAAGSCTGVS